MLAENVRATAKMWVAESAKVNGIKSRRDGA